MTKHHIFHFGKSVTESEKELIVVHGRGGSAKGMLSLAEEFINPSYHVTLVEALGNTWYPHSFMVSRSANSPYLEESINFLTEVIERAISTVGGKNTIVLGFSQGACLTLECAANSSVPLGGVVSFTGGLIGEELQGNLYKGVLQGTKVYMSNSVNDMHVPLSRTVASEEIFLGLGADVKLEIKLDNTHMITSQEVQTVKNIFF